MHRSVLALSLPFALSVANLVTAGLRADGAVLLTPGPIVEIPHSAGKFDFLEVDSVNHRLLAAHEKSGTADFIDLNTNQLLTRVKTGPAVHIKLDPKNGNYYVSDSEDKNIAVLDAATLKQTGTIATDGELDAILYEPKNDRIYVTNDESTHVWAIDPATAKVVATINISGPPEYMLYDASADRIYLNLKKTNEVAVIDPGTNTIVATWSTLPATSPHGLAFDPATGRLFPAGQNGKLSVIDVKTGNVIGSADFAKGVDQNVFDPSTKRIYCACGTKMSVLQETDDGVALLGSIETPATAKNVAVDPQTHAVWTTYTDGKDSFAKSWTP